MANPYRHYGANAPYYAPFDRSKNYVKVLYNPGYALQSRELIDQQSYLQNQIASLGGYFFKDGSPIDGAGISYSTNQPLIEVEVSSLSSLNYDIEEYLEIISNNMVFTANDNTEQQILVTGYYIDTTNSTSPSYYLLYSNMGTGIADRTVSCTFASETNDEAFKFTTIPDTESTAESNALVAACAEGTIFVDGYFITVPKSNIFIGRVLKNDDGDVEKILIDGDWKSASEVRFYIGYRISRNVITAYEDDTLYDTAIGSYNYKAPGADRQQINAELISYYEYYNVKTETNTITNNITVTQTELITNINDIIPTSSDESEINFVSGIIITGDGTLLKEQNTDVNSNMADLLAKRTYEESGSYTVTPWKVQLSDLTLKDIALSDLTITDVTGYSTESLSKVSSTDATTITESTLDKFYKVSIQPGLGYIYGYRINTLMSNDIIVKKPREYNTKYNVVDYIPEGIYTYAQLETDTDIKETVSTDSTILAGSLLVAGSTLTKDSDVTGSINFTDTKVTLQNDITLTSDLYPPVDSIINAGSTITNLRNDNNSTTTVSKIAGKVLIRNSNLILDKDITLQNGKELSTNNFEQSTIAKNSVIKTKSELYKDSEITASFTTADEFTLEFNSTLNSVENIGVNGIIKSLSTITAGSVITGQYEFTSDVENCNDFSIISINSTKKSPIIKKGSKIINGSIINGITYTDTILDEDIILSNISKDDFIASGSTIKKESILTGKYSFEDTKLDIPFDITVLQSSATLSSNSILFKGTILPEKNTINNISFTIVKTKFILPFDIKIIKNSTLYANSILASESIIYSGSNLCEIIEFNEDSSNTTNIYGTKTQYDIVITDTNDDYKIISNSSLNSGTIITKSSEDTNSDLIFNFVVDSDFDLDYNITITDSSKIKSGSILSEGTTIISGSTFNGITLTSDYFIKSDYEYLALEAKGAMLDFSSNELCGLYSQKNGKGNKLGECRITNIERNNFDVILYLTNVTVSSGIFSLAKSIAIRTDETDENTCTSYINLRQNSNDYSEIYGTDVPKIMETGYSYCAPIIKSKNNSTEDGKYNISYTKTAVYNKKADLDKTNNLITISFTLEINESVNDKDIIYIYDKVTGKYISPLNVKIQLSSDSNNTKTNVKIISNNNEFIKDNDYQVSFKVQVTNASPRTKILKTGYCTLTYISNSNSNEDLTKNCWNITTNGYGYNYNTVTSAYSVETTTYNSTTMNAFNLDDTVTIPLQECDIYKLIYISYSANSDSSTYYAYDYDLKNYNVSLDTGQRDYCYDYGNVKNVNITKIFTSLLKDNENLTLTDGTSITICYLYFEHTSDNYNNIGPFTASSYINSLSLYNINKQLQNTTYSSNINDITGTYYDTQGNTTLLDMYTIIPQYRSSGNNKIYLLRDCLDFRQKVTETNKICLTPEEKISYNISYYLPRIDAVWVDKSGQFGVTYGLSSQNPEVPEDKDGALTLYYLYNDAYVCSLTNVIAKYLNNQRHTMADITTIENRITNLENAVSLSLLEQSATNTQILDENGINKYKTGIFTDTFSSFNDCDYTNEEWNATIDSVECSIRPLYNCIDYNFKISRTDSNNYNSNNNYTFYTFGSADEKTGLDQINDDDNILTIAPIGKVLFASNTSVTETKNLQTLSFNSWIGDLKLTPSIDNWVKELGNISYTDENIDVVKAPTAFRIWSNGTINAISSNSSTTSYTVNKDTHSPGYWEDKYDTNNSKYTTYSNSTTVTETTSYTGSWSTNSVYNYMEEQNAYMREREVQYSIKGMRPNTIIKATIDGIDVELKPINANNLSYIFYDSNLSELGVNNETAEDIEKNSIYALINDDGCSVGKFTIPENIPCGRKLVEFYDATGTITTGAETDYEATGKTVDTNEDRTYIRTWTSVTNTSTSESSNSTALFTSSETSKVSTMFHNTDPIAETFTIDSENGIMLESIDLYFAEKDDNTGVNIYIVECKNGIPSNTLVPFSQVYVPASEVNAVSTDAVAQGTMLKATNFKFKSPIYLAPDTEYAFIVIAPSSNYKIYISTLGNIDLVTGLAITQQPFTGCMFRSQNLRNWNSEQLSDITFNMYKYKFPVASDTEDIYAVFNVDVNSNNLNSETEGAVSPNSTSSTSITGSTTSYYYPVAMQTLSLNTFIPAKTNIKYAYKYSNYFNVDTNSTINVTADDNIEHEFNNKEDTFNSQLNCLFVSNSYSSMQIIVALSTYDENISPMIDLEQVYGIFTNNIIEHNVIEGGSITPYTVNETEYAYYCGTYLSNSINIDNESSDLRVIVDAILPNNSGLKVSFRTTDNYYQSYIKHVTSIDDLFTKSSDGEELVGKTLRVYYVNSINNTFDFIPAYKITNNSDALCKISSYNDSIIYLNSISDETIFYNYDYTNSKYDTSESTCIDSSYNISNICIIPSDEDIYCLDSNDEKTTVLEYWSASKTYQEGECVIYSNSVWKALKSGLTKSNTPCEISIVWRRIQGLMVGSTLECTEGGIWRDMKCDALQKRTTSKTEETFKEYTFIPVDEMETTFTDFTIRIDMYSQDAVNVPRFRNLRAIAVI